MEEENKILSNSETVDNKIRIESRPDSYNKIPPSELKKEEQ